MCLLYLLGVHKYKSISHKYIFCNQIFSQNSREKNVKTELVICFSSEFKFVISWDWIAPLTNSLWIGIITILRIVSLYASKPFTICFFASQNFQGHVFFWSKHKIFHISSSLCITKHRLIAIKNNIQQGSDPIHLRVKDNLPTRGINYSGTGPVFISADPIRKLVDPIDKIRL